MGAHSGGHGTQLARKRREGGLGGWRKAKAVSSPREEHVSCRFPRTVVKGQRGPGR